MPPYLVQVQKRAKPDQKRFPLHHFCSLFLIDEKIKGCVNPLSELNQDIIIRSNMLYH